MQFRRRWNAMALAATLLASSAAFAAPVPATEIPGKFATLKGPDAVAYKDQVLRDAPTGIGDRNKYAGDVSGALASSKIFTTGTNVDGQLNAAMTIVEIGTISSDSCLTHMLTSPNPGVRYWAAKGLAKIATRLIDVGGGAEKRATAALNAALAKETSPVAKAQIVRALVAFASATNIDPLIDCMKVLADDMQTAFPDRETLDTASFVVKTFAGFAKTAMLKAPQKAAAADALARLASFATQQELTKAAEDRPTDYHNGVLAVINNSFDALNQVIGKSIFKAIDPKSDADSTALEVRLNVGSGSSSLPGTLQKQLPGTPIPPAIKAPATAPK